MKRDWDINFAVTEYQEEPEVNRPVDRGMRRELSSVPFPSYPDPNFTEMPEYEGYKMFGLEGVLCVSRFGYRGATDVSDRPVMSCSVALLSEEGFDSVGRDVSLIKEYLEKERSDLSRDGLLEHYRGAQSIEDREVVEDVCWRSDLDFLSAALSVFMSSDDTNIYYDVSDTAEDLIRMAYGILPYPRLSEISLTSECHSPEMEDAEDFKLIPSAEKGDMGVEDEEGSSALGLFGGGDDEVEGVEEIDIPEQSSDEGGHRNTIYPILEEMTEGEGWYDIGWDEKRSLLIEYLEKKYQGERPDLIGMSEELRRMENTVESVRSIE